MRGVLPAVPGGRYMVSAVCRTEGLVYSRGVIRARMLDTALKPIPGTEAVSDAMVTDGRWMPVQSMLPGHDDAAWIQIELELLQPSEMPGAGAAVPSHEVRPQDFSGSVWFDDVRVYQVPLVELLAKQHASTAVEPDSPELTLRVQDLTGETLRAQVRVVDIDGNVVDSFETPVESGGRPVAWKPRLPALGWYRVRLQVLGPEGPVAERVSDIAWLEGGGPIERAARRGWGVIAENVQAEHVPMLPELLEHTGTGAVSLSVWSHVGLGDSGPEDPAEREAADSTVNKLVEQRQELTFVLGHAPAEMARDARIDPDDPIAILAGPNDVWMQGVSALLSRFGERVMRWQVGPTGSERAFWRESLAADLRAVQRGFRGLVPTPMMTAPWRLDQSVYRAMDVDAVTMVCPVNVPAIALPYYDTQWLPQPGKKIPEVTLVIQPPDVETFGRRESMEELAKRAVTAWSAGVPRLSVSLPWSFEPTERNAAVERPSPLPSLPVWRTLARHLASRIPAGELPVATGVVAILAQGAEDGAVIAWNSHADPADAVLAGYLGAGPIAVTDIFGNRRVLGSGEAGRIVLGTSPLIIEGVDVNLLRLRAGVKVSPAYLPARAERHTLNVVVTNPWRAPVSGNVRLAEPEAWEMSPRVIPFVLQGGQTKSYPFTVSLGVGETAGERVIVSEVELTSDRRYPTLRLNLPVEIGLETIQMQPSFRYLPGPGGALTDLMVSLLVTNLDSRPVTLESFVHAPGLRSQQAPISALGPGESAIRRFVFPNAAEALRGKKVLTGLKEMGGTGRLNKVIEIQ